jgi:hypothetical protein
MPNFFSGMPAGGLATLFQGGSIQDALKNQIPLGIQGILALAGNKSLSPAFSQGGNMAFLGMNKNKQRQGEAPQSQQYANTQAGQPQGQAPQGQYIGTQAPNPYYNQYQMAQMVQHPRQGGM